MSILSTLATLRSTAAGSPAGLPSPPAMVDLAFALDGERLPHAYAFPLEAALLAALPWLADDDVHGIHPIRAPRTDFGLILSRRARLVLRLPEQHAERAGGLSGQRLQVGDATLVVGAPTLRRIAPFATLHSWHVATSAADEQGFVDDVAMQLEALGVKAHLICGKRETLADGNRRIAGFGLALHELSPAHSLLLQAVGLGAGRRLGCGIFVQHKIIEGLGGEPD